METFTFEITVRDPLQKAMMDFALDALDSFLQKRDGQVICLKVVNHDAQTADN